MTRTFRIIAVAFLAGLVSACATMTPKERAAACSATDWERYGQNDGRLGIPTSSRAGDFEDCAEVGKPVDLAAYQAGRSAGLESYCTVENGYQVGYDGRRYQKVCPPTLEPDFLQGYDQGRKERPAVALYPNIGIGIGSGGRVRTGIGIGIGIGSFYGCDRHGPFRHRCW